MNPYLDPNRVRAALRALELHPTRGMGQNFLIDPHALAQIVDAGAITSSDLVLEVGPGLGVLTWELLQRAGQVVAVELDRRLAARLEQEFAANPRLRIVQGDILRLLPGEVLGDRGQGTGDRGLTQEHHSALSTQHSALSTQHSALSTQHSALSTQHSALSTHPAYKVIANLPYAITSPVLRHFLEAASKPQLMVLMVQWEVAQRIVAAPGNLSMLAHSVQLYAAPAIVARIEPTSFVPQPAVASAILRLHLYDRPVVEVDNIDAFMRVIKAGFLQPRKKLSNALPGGLAALGQPIERAVALAALQAAGVSPDRRAETVTLAEWGRVYQTLRGRDWGGS